MMKKDDKKKILKRISIILAIALIVGVWFFLNSKLIFGEDWISPTYDKESWRTNEGDLHTFGAWDIETHIWKSEYIFENFPNFQYNPYWYMGMPLLKYYQSSFYILNIVVKFLTGTSFARAALLLIIYAHLLATLLTFLVCYSISKKEWVSSLLSIFLLSLSFISLRSYGWEPITVVFLFLYPLGLYYFLKEPEKPFRLSLIIIMALSYLSHPLIFFSLAMTFGLYLFSLAITEKRIGLNQKHEPYILKYFVLVFVSLLISAVQFFPQISYNQVTSGAHMGVSYIPFYHVQYNVISIGEFLFSATNLKGPGFIILVSFFIFLTFYYIERGIKKNNREFFEFLKGERKTLFSNHIVRGFLFVLVFMILFYYLELYNIFPMNILRSIQYHRIIPEFVIASAVLVAGMSNIINTRGEKILYYSFLIGFVLASLFVVYDIQDEWDTTSDISSSPEFITDAFEGRISFPYTDQSLAVRNSFTKVPQIYGYYEQGVTNSYADELFSVSSGYHEINTSLIYLKAANVARLYVNKEEGERDRIMEAKLNKSFELEWEEGNRYGYFEIPLINPSFAQVVDLDDVNELQKFKSGTRTLFKEKYVGSLKEEFVGSDREEIRYLEKYLELLDNNLSTEVNYVMRDPEHYRIEVLGADENSAIVFKMDYDSDFRASIDGERIDIEEIGPEFMLISPRRNGDYVIDVEYKTSKVVIIGGIVSILSLVFVLIYFFFEKSISGEFFKLKGGNLA